MSRHGKEVAEKQIELRRLADIAIDIYAMTAVLGRSSRSYCIGLQNAEHEVNALRFIIEYSKQLNFVTDSFGSSILL